MSADHKAQTAHRRIYAFAAWFMHQTRNGGLLLPILIGAQTLTVMCSTCRNGPWRVEHGVANCRRSFTSLPSTGGFCWKAPSIAIVSLRVMCVQAKFEGPAGTLFQLNGLWADPETLDLKGERRYFFRFSWDSESACPSRSKEEV